VGDCCCPAACAEVLTVDAYLAAVGRVSNTDQLGLAALGVQLDPHGCARVRGPSMETDAPGVFAAGDVVGRPYLASTGVAQAAAAVAGMFKAAEEGATAGASQAAAVAPQAASPWQVGPFCVGALCARPSLRTAVFVAFKQNKK